MEPSRSISPDASALERLAHVARQICELWGKEELESYLNGIIVDSRDGRRQGLPMDVVEEMLFLLELIVAKRALYASETTGVPFRQAFRAHLEKSQKFAVFKVESADDPWFSPRDRHAMGRADQGAPAAKPASVKPARPRRKKSWWRRLVGLGSR